MNEWISIYLATRSRTKPPVDNCLPKKKKCEVVQWPTSMPMELVWDISCPMETDYPDISHHTTSCKHNRCPAKSDEPGIRETPNGLQGSTYIGERSQRTEEAGEGVDRQGSLKALLPAPKLRSSLWEEWPQAADDRAVLTRLLWCMEGQATLPWSLDKVWSKDKKKDTTWQLWGPKGQPTWVHLETLILVSRGILAAMAVVFYSGVSVSRSRAWPRFCANHPWDNSGSLPERLKLWWTWESSAKKEV